MKQTKSYCDYCGQEVREDQLWQFLTPLVLNNQGIIVRNRGAYDCCRLCINELETKRKAREAA